MNYCTTTATFNFILEDASYATVTPYEVVGNMAAGEEDRRTNIKFEEHSNLTVHDMRPLMNELEIDEHGIEFLRYAEFSDSDPLQQGNPYPFLERIEGRLKKHFAAKHVFVYSQNASGVTNPSRTLGTGESPDAPVKEMHTDATVKSGLDRVKQVAEARGVNIAREDRLRLRIINLWIPLVDEVHDMPLAFCRPHTVREGEIIAVHRVAVNRPRDKRYLGEVSYLKFNDAHEFQYLSRQRKSEVAMFLSYDSEANDETSFMFHASFNNPQAKDSMPPRRSLEIRAVVITNAREQGL
ncbi:hypothetical protein CC80DRAFT_555157 [Byssothecium circinans]|uniref:Methyltransferase n=1 Tax=Byssothecium circinans TaxID=147558 RepID=A0A6A5TD40_9PLEO|nr:hypothetical protein CC80DRAFT_555157 [Byssothecium circinans]